MQCMITGSCYKDSRAPYIKNSFFNSFKKSFKKNLFKKSHDVFRFCQFNFNPFMHNVVKCVNMARFLKYVWPFYNIMHEKVNCMKIRVACSRLVGVGSSYRVGHLENG